VGIVYLDPRWFAVMLGSAAAFSALSPLVYARRFNFFAASLPHAALLAAALGYVAAALLGGSPAAWAVLLSLPPSLLLVLLLHKGVSEDSATSAFVAFTTSAGVAAVYYVLTSFPARVSLWSYILGDPLLAGWEDAALAVAVAALSIAASLLLLQKEVSIGLDSDFSSLSGIRVKLHDYALAALLTLVSVSLLRAVGFVVEHVALLLPAAISSRLARNTREFLALSVLPSLAAALLGLLLAVQLNLAPAAAYGFVLLAAYLISLLRGGGA
jgi:ABC-type Mn2+/Zn2+ transport system permease subunit